MREHTTAEWLSMRHGKFTASRISDLLVTSKSKDKVFGETAMKYIHQVACERLIPYEDMPRVTSASMEWGSEHEGECMQYYQAERLFENDYLGVEYYGKDNPMFFTIPDHEYAGASPDGIEHRTDGDYLIEIKCPYNPENHLDNLNLTLDEFKAKRKEYYAQIQFNMLAMPHIKGATFLSYDPRFAKRDNRLAVLEIPKDEEFIERLVERLEMAEEEVSNITADR